MQLVLDTKGIQVTKKNDTFYMEYIEGKKGSRSISPGKLTSIAITANVLISTAAISLAVQHKIPILIFDRFGKIKGRFWSPRFESLATLRRQQVKFTESTDATTWLIDIFDLKSAAQIRNLQYLQMQQPKYSSSISKVIQAIKKNNRSFQKFKDQYPEACRQQMMGVEGSIARQYWQMLGNALPRQYTFQKRSRRPAQDIFNAALNYLYGMLYSIIEGGLFHCGLDPYIGILHTDEYNKPTLSFDMIEPFRPWVDRLLLEAFFNSQIKKSFFTKNQHGVFLNKTGKAFIIPLFNQWLRTEIKYLDREATTKNQIYFICGRLASHIRAGIEG